MSERELFLAARELRDLRERARFLDRACACDAALRARRTLLGRELRLESEAVKHRYRPQDRKKAIVILSLAQSSADGDHVAASVNSVDVSRVANMAPDLRCQVRLQVFGSTFLKQGIGMIFVGNAEFQAIDDFAHARGLLGGPINDHRLIS